MAFVGIYAAGSPSAAQGCLRPRVGGDDEEVWLDAPNTPEAATVDVTADRGDGLEDTRAVDKRRDAEKGAYKRNERQKETARRLRRQTPLSTGRVRAAE
ncbi:hypothetical protein FGB62_257g08 [Gracilaria domingensis]|nr:hypothetical protein FGB62_257g08 [Gracilaria domingensis]